ncbi:MAG: class F sortase, partial [Dehalococcoidia bacterium]
MPKSLPALTNTRTLLGLAALAAMLCAIVLVACSGGGDDDDPIDVTTPTATEGATTSTATASSTPRATSTQTRTPTATSTEATRTDQPLPTAVAGADVLSSLRDLVSDHGYPSGTDFARIRIPALGVDAQIGSRYVGTDGVMPDPGGPADVVWYDLSAWAGMGGAPGGGGNAIFSGHVDYNANVGYAGVHYRGQAVFSGLGDLNPGDVIEV